MNELKFESSVAKQTALSLACISVGMVLAIGFQNFSGSGNSNSLAGFLLGILLLIIGISGFLVRGKQTIVIDPKTRCIMIEDSNQFSTKKRSIRFSDIVHTGIGYVGKKSSHVTFYYINLTLKNGEEYSLFAPGRFFEGGSDRSVMENRRQHLEEYFKQYR